MTTDQMTGSVHRSLMLREMVSPAPSNLPYPALSTHPPLKRFKLLPRTHNEERSHVTHWSENENNIEARKRYERGFDAFRYVRSLVGSPLLTSIEHSGEIVRCVGRHRDLRA